MLAVVHSYWVHGVEGRPVRVEVKVQTGLPVFTVVGLPAGAVREGKERVFAALAHAGISLPPRRVTVNLAPADLPKSGSGFDLPVAVGLLAASGSVPLGSLEGSAFVGELGLDGAARPIRGAIALAMSCLAEGRSRLFVPLGNAREASAAPGVKVFGVANLSELVAHLRSGDGLRPKRRQPPVRTCAPGPDLCEVRGQEMAKRALVVAAAGGHSLLMSGPPGAGKTMLARRLPGLLPPLSEPESLEVTRVHSVAGLLDANDPVKTTRPFRAPHHTISAGGLVGGGSPPRPGEISLAHLGVLFLDELPEFGRRVLETLRQPIESGRVRVARVRHSVTFPARFQVVAAMNSCPCGLGGDDCVCQDRDVARYRARISGPLLDRLDIHVGMSSVTWQELKGAAREAGQGSDEARAQVAEARRRQAVRYRTVAVAREDAREDAREGDTTAESPLNARIPARDLMAACPLASEASRLLEDGVGKFRLSARAVHRTLRTARTIADLAGEERLEMPAVAEALQLRVGFRSG